jgi:translation initiation factor 4E
MAEGKRPADEPTVEKEEGEISPENSGEPDFTKKHPLETRWTLWFDNPGGKQTLNKYGQSLRAVYTFDSVEDFWW